MKYSRAQLRSMAQQFLISKDSGDMRAHYLLMVLVVRCMLPYGTCLAQIEGLAR